ncbi:hypothetical protein [Flavobacterium sp.]|uniref:hypothetical protein n=1 Tax=Flavobacterium sp. TaxID=239 RepID=UPI0039E3AD4E
MIYFPLLQRQAEFEFGYGLYHLFFSGGFSIDNLDSLDIHLFNAQTKETMTLSEKSFKSREMIAGQKAICCFAFQINDWGRYQIQIGNPEILVLKNSPATPLSLLKMFSTKPEIDPKGINVIIK